MNRVVRRGHSCYLIVDQIHRHLDQSARLQTKSECFEVRQTAVARSDCACDLARDGDVGSEKNDVESDQKWTCANRNRARRLVNTRNPRVWCAIGIDCDLFTKQLQRTTTDVFQIHAFRTHSGALVIVDRDQEIARDYCAGFVSDTHTAMLRDMAAGVDAARFGAERLELPVKLKVHESVFVPLAKWSMLLAGNYRCVQEDGMRSIRDAVHTDLDASRAVYESVGALCRALGADPADLVPFEKYAEAARSLASPSSAARALANGAPNIERVDRLVQTLMSQRGLSSPEIDRTVALVDGWVEANRRKA